MTHHRENILSLIYHHPWLYNNVEAANILAERDPYRYSAFRYMILREQYLKNIDVLCQQQIVCMSEFNHNLGINPEWRKTISDRVKYSIKPIVLSRCQEFKMLKSSYQNQIE